VSVRDATHDPALQSWVCSANADGTDFPVQNLPFGRFRRAGSTETLRMGVAIGDQVLDLREAAETCPWAGDVRLLLAPLAAGDLLDFMALGPSAWRAMRWALSQALAAGSEKEPFLLPCLVPQAACEMALPCRIGDYTDFYTSLHHATTVGRQFRPDNPLLPNYKWVPIGYHGRASSIVVSGKSLHRPVGQTLAAGASVPTVGASQRLDYELEIGALVGGTNAQGQHMDMVQAESAIFGLVLFNDWSARDIQGWEYQPLGPFLSKNFGSTASPWVVTMDALVPFRQAFVRPEEDPQPLPYLDSPHNRSHGAIGIELQVWLQTEHMRQAGHAGQCLSQSNFADAYWTLAQLVAHHTVGGCNLQAGDLLGSGTLSGPAPEQGGSLLELGAGGKRPVKLNNGEERSFLQDGDTVTLRGACQRAGARRIGFGGCSGTVLPARL
jgi:fumarylacetoacetase